MHSLGPLKPGGSLMKITRIMDLHADAGWRVFSFLKIETDTGIVGWSEYNESYGSKGLTGENAPGAGWPIQQAIAAIENAL
jgi:hypothetical protein